MGKKKIELPAEGSPAYMGLYTTLMIVLLAFFIVLNSMSTQQEAGFHEGIGQVQDAFGLEGGVGLLQFQFFRLGRGAPPVPAGMGKEDGRIGFHKATVEGEGGSGVSDEEVQQKKLAQYVRVMVPFEFEQGSDVIPVRMAEYLNVTGMGFAVFDSAFTIRSYTRELGDPEMNRDLAARRAMAIMRYLRQACSVPYEKMSAAGYAYPRYFEEGRAPSVSVSDMDQVTFFYVYRGSSAQVRPAEEAVPGL